jgi:hypothetical protein
MYIQWRGLGVKTKVQDLIAIFTIEKQRAVLLWSPPKYTRNVSDNMMKIESYNKILKLSKNKKFVEVTLKEEKPSRLYKYYALNKNSLSNLTDNKIHFSHPYTLNDIMDGNFQLLNLENVYKKIIQKDFGEQTTLNDFNKYFNQKSNEFYK